jgi:hypothetical protein
LNVEPEKAPFIRGLWFCPPLLSPRLGMTKWQGLIKRQAGALG